MPTLTPLSDLLSVDLLPESLHLSNLATGFLDDIEFKDHIVTGESASKHEATHKMTLVFTKTIGFAFPGSEIKLLLNPTVNGSAQSTELKIEVYYKWNILKFIADFKINNVPTNLDALLPVIESFYSINLNNVLEKLILKYEQAAATIQIPIQAIIDELNRFYALTGTANEISFTTTTPSFEEIEAKLLQAGVNLAQVVSDFNLGSIVSDPTSPIEVLGAVIKKGVYQLVETLNSTYSLSGTSNIIEYRPQLDFNDVITKLTNIGKDAFQIIKDLVVDVTASFSNITDTLFSFLTINTTDLPTSFDELFIPEVDASVEDVNLALEFPRSMLIPMDDNDEFIADPATAKLTFQVGDFDFSTQNGFDFQEVSTCELKKASVLETGITIEFTNCVIDFHTDSNIPEADADNRPLAFQGVFIDESIISLPKFWQEDPSKPTTAVIVGNDMLIGMPGGITGALEMKTDASAPDDLLHFDIPGVMKVSVKDFDLTFAQNIIDETNINGTLSIPMIKKTDGSDSAIDVHVNIVNDIYTIEATQFDPVLLAEIELDIQSLIVTLQNGEVIPPTSMAGNLTFPVVDDGSSNPAPMVFSAEILENSKKIKVASVPDLSLLGIGIKLHAFEIEFNDTQILNGDISGTITFPFLNDPAHPEQPFGLGINYVIKEDGFEIHATDISRLDLLGLGVVFKNVDIIFDKNTQSFNLEGNLFLPAFINEDEEEAALGFNFTVTRDQYKLICSPVPLIYLLGCEIQLEDFEFSFTKGHLDDFDLAGSIVFPVLVDEAGELVKLTGFSLGISETNYSIGLSNIPWLYLLGLGIKFRDINVSFSKSSLDKLELAAQLSIPYLSSVNDPDNNTEMAIDFDLEINDTGYKIDIENIPPLYLCGIELDFHPIDLTIPKAGSMQLSLGGDLIFPVVESPTGGIQKIGFNLDYNPGKYTISASSSNLPPLSLGGLDITLTGLTIAFDDSGIIADETEISGKISIPAFNIELEIKIEIKDNGFFIEAKAPQGTDYIDVLNLEDLIQVKLAQLAIGKEGDIWTFGFGGKIINKLSVPGLEKFVPETIDVKKFDLLSENEIALNLDMVWPNGFKVENIGKGGSTTVPVNQSFGDVMSIRAIQIDTRVTDKTEIEVGLLGTKFSLGPVTCTIDGIGLEATIEQKENGNMGPIDVALNFVPPKGIGIALETDIIRGGGYLLFDYDNNRYAGAVELSFMGQFSLSAIGLLTTVLPDGTKGTSLLIIITTLFPAPIPLGYNFYLYGVGGIIGLHRTVNADKLREGVANNSIESVLFPQNVISNISRIISDLRELFPPKKDQFLMGPMAKITWNSPPLLSLELGLIVEFDDPFAIIILGVMRACMPNQDTALIKLQVNFVGIINFDEGYISFDAALFDSRIVSFTLEGSMALRMTWGKHSDFAVSVGGFHPAYRAPSHLKFFDMKRLTICLMGGNPKLTLTSYFAITTNTVQFGASIDFLYKVWKVKVVGWFGFDVLFQFDPFKFVAAVSAGMAVKWDDSTLFSISLSFSLAGPSPWMAKGTAKFKVLFYTVKVNFSRTWGEEKNIPLPDIRVLPLVIEALENSSNWKSELLSTKNYELVVLRAADVDEADIIIASNGTLSVTQKIVPLGIEISKFGNSHPVGDTLFEIKSIGLVNTDGETILSTSHVNDDFIPAAYKDMEDADKLSSPSFEKMRSGVKADAMDDLVTKWGINRDVEYEVIVSDYKAEDPALIGEGMTCLGRKMENPSVIPPGLFTYFAKGGAISNSAISKRKKAGTIKNIRKVSLYGDHYKVVYADTLQNYPTPGFTMGSRAEANEVLVNMIKADASLKGKLLVIREQNPEAILV